MASVHHLTLAPLTPADLGEAASVVQASGLGTTLAELQRRSALPATFLLGARREERLIGVAGAIAYGAIGVIGPMSVLPQAQGQGIGTALLRALLDWLRRHGVETITLDATPAGAPLYRRHGFVADDRMLHLARRAPTQEQALHVWRHDGQLAVTPAAPADLAELDRFDAPAFGASRRALLARYLVDFPGRVMVARRDGGLAGYAVAQEGRIGPCVAAAATAAAAVLTAAAALPFEAPPLVSAPQTNEAALAVLAALGFAETRRLERMRLGGSCHPGDLTRIYAIASYALG